MCLKNNYCRDSILGRRMRMPLIGIVSLCLVLVDVCSGAMMNELKKESTSYQKFSSGKSIKYYKNIQSGTNLEPLSYNLTVLHKPSKKLIGGNNWVLTSKNSQGIPKNGALFLDIPLEVPEKYLKKSLNKARALYLDYTEEYVNGMNRKHKDVKHSIVMLKIFIENKQMNRKWVIYAPYLYIAGQVDLPEEWAPKNIWYLIRREIGLHPNNIGRFSHEPNGSFFKIRLHKLLDNYDGMKISVDGSRSLPVEDLGPREDERVFQMRVGAKDDLNYSGIIFMDAILSNHKNDLVATSYLSNDYSEIQLEDESNIYLEELTFNFPLREPPSNLISFVKQTLEPPSNLISFVKKISFYKSSKKRLIANLKKNLFEPIFLSPRYIISKGEGVGRLEIALPAFPGKLKNGVLADGTKIIKAGLIVDTRGSFVRKVSVFEKGFLKFRDAPELVVFENKKYLNQQDLLDKFPAPIDHIEIFNDHAKNTTKSFNVLWSFFCFVGIIFCFIGLKNYKKILTGVRSLVTTILGRLHARSNYYAYFGLFMYFLGLLISMFAGVVPYNQVYDIDFVFKDAFYTLGGLTLAVNWKYQCVKIYMRLKNSRLNALRKFFKNYNSSYLTGAFVALCFCSVSRQFYLPLVESFSSLSISLIIVGTYHYIYQKAEYKFEVPANYT